MDKHSKNFRGTACSITLSAFFLTASVLPASVLPAFVLPAFAAMDSLAEQHYKETMQAAQACADTKDFAKAREKYGEARKIAEEGQDRKREIKVISCLGNLAMNENDYPAAEAKFREAVAMAEAGADPADGPYANHLYDLSNVLILEKKDREARKFFDRCIELSAKVYSDNHPILAVRKAEYGELLNRLGDTAAGAKNKEESSRAINRFMEDMTAKIQKAWLAAPQLYSYTVAVAYDVFDHGRVDNVRISKSSNSVTSDKAALLAVRAAAPFSDITSSGMDAPVPLVYHFDYNRHSVPNAAQSDKDKARLVQPSREVIKDSQNRVKEEEERGTRLKEQIDAALKDGAKKPAELAALYVEYAENLRIRGQQAQAVRELNQALSQECFREKRDGPSISLLIAMGRAYLHAPKLGRPEVPLKQAIEASAFPQVPDALRKQALVDYGDWLSKDQKYSEAQTYYSRAREIKE